MFSTKTPSVAEMLSETGSETAAQLMSSLLYRTSPPGSTSLPGLDAQLLSGATSLASPTSSLNRGDVLEIQGPAASGKTRFVYNLVMQCTLPRKISLSKGSIPSDVEIGGWEKTAFVFDTDGRWNARRLTTLLRRHLEESLPSSGGTQSIIQDVLVQCLQRLHIFRPKSSSSLAATLFRLPTYHAELFPTGEIALLAIDSISSFYWTDRYNLEQQHPSRRNEEASPLSRILVALQEFRLSHGPVTVLTNWGLAPLSGGTATDSSSEPPSPFYHQHLHPFPAPLEVPSRLPPNAQQLPPITHHITLMPSAVNHVPSEVSSLQEAMELSRTGSVGIRKREIKGILRMVETSYVINFTLENHEDV